MKITHEIESYALGYYYGRAEGSYGLLDLDQFSDAERHAFKLGYDRGVTDYCEYDTVNYLED
jgi:hypothetical protein